MSYGPFHRIESPTQSSETAKLQQESQQIWGRARRHSDIPQVQAYLGPLPQISSTTQYERGIEFWTHAAPDKGTVHARWTGPRDGVVVEGGFAKVDCVMTRNTQTQVIVEKVITVAGEEEEEEEEEEALELQAA